MHLALALTAVQKGAILLLITGVAAPIAGFWFLRSGDAWRSLGRGPFAIEPRGAGAAPPAAAPRPGRPGDPGRRGAADAGGESGAAAAARRARRWTSRRRRRGCWRTAAERPPAGERMRGRAARRSAPAGRRPQRTAPARQGLDPLDVEAETERQLADLEGSAADLVGSPPCHPLPTTTSTRSRSCWSSRAPTSTRRPRSWSSSTTPPRSTRRSSTWRPTRAPSWVRISDEVPIDEDGRDRALEAFQTHYHPGSTGSVSETALEQGDEELDEDEEGQDPGRED